MSTSAIPSPCGVAGWCSDRAVSRRLGWVACGEAGKTASHAASEAVRFCCARGFREEVGQERVLKELRERGRSGDERERGGDGPGA